MAFKFQPVAETTSKLKTDIISRFRNSRLTAYNNLLKPRFSVFLPLMKYDCHTAVPSKLSNESSEYIIARQNPGQ